MAPAAEAATVMMGGNHYRHAPSLPSRQASRSLTRQRSELSRRIEDDALALFAPPPPPPAAAKEAKDKDILDHISSEQHNSKHDDTYNQEASLSRRLAAVESDFLMCPVVSTPVTEADIRDRFRTWQMANFGAGVGEYVDSLVEDAVVDSMHVSCPRMIGHMTSALPYYTRPLAKLVVAMNQNAVKSETAKTITCLEREAMAQLHRALFNNTDAFYAEHIQSPAVALGLMTSGGTIANITALWIARNSKLGPDTTLNNTFAGVEQEGLVKALKHYGYTDACVVGSELMHYSMDKAADVLGIGVRGLRKVAVDANYRVDVKALARVLDECAEQRCLVLALVGIAGATETGAVDPLREMARIARERGVHFHVDAAWGGPMCLSDRLRKSVSGLELADTVTLDGHKQLLMPMGGGMVFLRDPALSRCIRKAASYIIREESHDAGKFTLEGSRPAQALFLHANLSILGRSGYGALMERLVRLARHLAKRLMRAHNFELLVKPMANILLYRWIPKSLRRKCWAGQLDEEDNKVIDEVNARLQERQKAEGRTFVSRTSLRCPKYGRLRVVALRVVIGNVLTTERDIDAVLEDQLALVPQLTDDCSVTPHPTDFIYKEGMEHVDDTDLMTWDRHWEQGMNDAERALFNNDKDLFLESLCAPDLLPTPTTPISASDATTDVSDSSDVKDGKQDNIADIAVKQRVPAHHQGS